MDTSVTPSHTCKESKNFKYEPAIELEENIANLIYTALQGDIVEAVLSKLPSASRDSAWRSNMEGHSLKVEEALLKDIYDLCQEVKEKLKYEGKIDFYITGDATVNAFSVASQDENEPSIININSGLFDLMSREELKFVIGHELGHLINKDTALARLINFIFPEGSKIPVSLLHKIRLHEQLAELVADRYGYIAAEDLGACVTAFYKLASGLDLSKKNISIDALINENLKRLEYFLNDQGISRASHPVNPIRVQALNLFANATSEEELNEGIDELIGILLKVGNGELDEYTARFIASAGLIVSNIDEGIAEEEVEHILEALANHKVFPREFLDEIAEGNVWDTFNDSVANMLRINPGMRDDMMVFMINTVMADNSINDKEISFLYDFGKNIGMSDIEVAQYIATCIQQNFIPDIKDIC